MSKRITLALVVSLMVVTQGAFFGAAAQPGPEQKKLDYLAGKWRSEVDIKASPASAASKASGTEDCEWFANLHLVCRAELTGPAGLYRSMRVISYLPALKQYSSFTVDSLGYAVLSLGQIQGNTWTFTTDSPGLKTRYVMKTAKDSYTSLAEYAGADGKWTTTSAGKSTRTKRGRR
jgi:hypothetical protein